MIRTIFGKDCSRTGIVALQQKLQTFTCAHFQVPQSKSLAPLRQALVSNLSQYGQITAFNQGAATGFESKQQIKCGSLLVPSAVVLGMLTLNTQADQYKCPVKCDSGFAAFDLGFALKQFHSHKILSDRPGHSLRAELYGGKPRVLANYLKKFYETTAPVNTPKSIDYVKYFTGWVPAGDNKLMQIKFSANVKTGQLGSVYETGAMKTLEAKASDMAWLYGARALASASTSAQVASAMGHGMIAGVCVYGGIRAMENIMGLSEAEQWELWKCLVVAGVVGTLAVGLAWWLVLPLFSAGALVLVVVTLASGAVIRYVASYF